MTHGTLTATSTPEIIDLNVGSKNSFVSERVDGEQPESLSRIVKRVIVALLVVQLIVMVVWSTTLYYRFALTWDYSMYQQGIWEIWHGMLNPPDTSLQGGLWGNSGQIIFWIMAFITYPLQHGPVILYLQDLAITASEVAVLVFSYEVLQERLPARSQWKPVLISVCAFILLVNPWTYWTISWDIHSEPFGTFFLIMAARALYRQNWRSLAVWSILTLTGGMVECEYLVAIGFVGLTLGKESRKAGTIMIAGSLFWFGMLDVVLHAATSIPPPGQVYGYLTNAPNNGAKETLSQIVFTVAAHPGRLLKQVWIERDNVIAVLSAGGLIGIFTRWSFFLSFVVITTNVLSRAFAITAFQNFPVFQFVTLGTVIVCVNIILNWPRIRKFLKHILVIVCCNCALWSVVWISQIKSEWLRITPSAATVLTKALHEIPSSNEVVASQGVSGRFSKRVNVYIPLVGDWRVPLYGKYVWWVLTSQQGIELASPSLTYGVMGRLAGPLHAQLMLHGSGVWIFRLKRSSSDHWFTTGLTNNYIPGWAVPGPSGYSNLNGPVSNWHAASTGKKGYTVAYAYWGESPGEYQVNVKMSATGSVNLEIWNATDNTLVMRRSPPPNYGVETLTYRFRITTEIPRYAYSGWGPFQILPNEPNPQNEFEIRVWSPGGERINVYSLTFAQLINNPVR